MKKIKFAVLATISILLVGCSDKDTNKISKSEAERYLENNYGVEFTLEDARYYVDDDEVSGEEVKAPDKIVYDFVDENGIESSILLEKNNGMFGYTYSVRDDYMVSFLFSNSEIYQPLENSDFEIDRNESDAGNLVINVEKYEDIESAVRLAYETVDNQPIIIPNDKFQSVDFSIYQIKPNMMVYSSQCDYEFSDLAQIPFKTQENKDVSYNVESLIEIAQNTYVDLVREGSIEENLPESILNANPPEQLYNVTYNGDVMLDRFYYSEEWKSYYLWENGEWDDENLNYPVLTNVLETLGYRTKSFKNMVLWSNGDNVVSIECKKTGDNSKYIIKKNGEKFSGQGKAEATSTVLRLSENDLKELFGITFKKDYINITAEVVYNEN